MPARPAAPSTVGLVADHETLGGVQPEGVLDETKDAWVRLDHPDFEGQDDRVDEVQDAEIVEGRPAGCQWRCIDFCTDVWLTIAESYSSS